MRIYFTTSKGELKYLKAARDLVKPERNTLTVSMKDVEAFNANLAQSIHDDYYRIYPYLCSGKLRNLHGRKSGGES